MVAGLDEGGGGVADEAGGVEEGGEIFTEESAVWKVRVRFLTASASTLSTYCSSESCIVCTNLSCSCERERFTPSSVSCTVLTAVSIRSSSLSSESVSWTLSLISVLS